MNSYVKITALMVGGCVQLGLLIINLMITSKMHIDDRGIYALIVAVVMTVSGLGNFGFVNALIKRMHKEQLAVNYVIGMAYLMLFQLIIVLGIVFVVLYSFPLITMELIDQLGLLVLFLVISLLLRAYGQAMLLGLNKISLFQISKIIPVVIFALVLILRNKYYLDDVLLAWMASEALLVVFLIFNTLIYFRISNTESDRFLTDMKFGIRSLFGHVAFIEGYKVDLIVLGYFIPVADLAIYAVSKSVALVLRFVPQSLSQVAYPILLKAKANDRRAILKRFIVASVLSGIVLMIVGYYLFSSFVIPYLGEAYNDSSKIVLVLFLSVLAYSPRRILYEYFKAENKPGITSNIEVLVLGGYVALFLICELLGFASLFVLALLILVINLVALIFSVRISLVGTGFTIWPGKERRR